MVKNNLHTQRNDVWAQYQALMGDGSWIYIRNIVHFYSKTHKIFLKRLEFIEFTASVPGCESLKLLNELEYRKFRVFLREHDLEYLDAPDYVEFTKTSPKVTRSIVRKNNKSGFIGVFFNKTSNKWYATLNANGVRYNLGTYKEKQDAIDARIAAEIEHLGSSFQ